MAQTTRDVRSTNEPCTAREEFLEATAESKRLLAICEGVPLSDAFDQLAQLLGNVNAVLDGLAHCDTVDDCQGSAWAAVHLLEAAAALQRSMAAGYMAFFNGRA